MEQVYLSFRLFQVYNDSGKEKTDMRTADSIQIPRILLWFLILVMASVYARGESTSLSYQHVIDILLEKPDSITESDVGGIISASGNDFIIGLAESLEREAFKWRKTPVSLEKAYRILAMGNAQATSVGYQRFVEGLNNDALVKICSQAITGSSKTDEALLANSLTQKLVAANTPDALQRTILVALRSLSKVDDESKNRVRQFFVEGPEDQGVAATAARTLVELEGVSKFVGLVETLGEKDQAIAYFALVSYYSETDGSVGMTTMDSIEETRTRILIFAENQLKNNHTLSTDSISAFLQLFPYDFFITNKNGHKSPNTRITTTLLDISKSHPNKEFRRKSQSIYDKHIQETIDNNEKLNRVFEKQQRNYERLVNKTHQN